MYVCVVIKQHLKIPNVAEQTTLDYFFHCCTLYTAVALAGVAYSYLQWWRHRCMFRHC